MFNTCKLLLLGAVLSVSACAEYSPVVRNTSPASRGVRFADAALSGGLPQAALNATRTVLEHEPHNVQALLQQGDALSTLGRWDAAMEAYRRILSPAASPNGEQTRRAQMGVGRAELAAGHATQAETAFRALVAAAPADAAAHSGLGIALDLQDRHPEAQTEYRAALAQADSDGTRVNLGLSLAMAGDWAGAIAVLRPLAQDPSASPKIRHNLAFALAMAGDKPAAERMLSADMPREQVVAALAGYTALRPAFP